MTEIKAFSTPQGQVCAHAAIPDDWVIGASIVNGPQHETVPFFITAHAIDTARNIMIFGLTDEMFTTYKNQLVKSALKMVPNIIWNSIRDFIEPEDYLYQFACAMSQMNLRPVAEADLPSPFGRNIQASYNAMMEEYNAYFEREASLGTPTFANNTLCRSYLMKYTGTARSGASCIVLAGMDYKGVEYYSTVTPMMGFAGLFGGRKENDAGSDIFGQGSPCDAIDWGAANKYLVVAPAEYEAEATKAFLDFVSTFHMDDALRQQFYSLRLQRSQMMMQQSLQFQQMAQQSRINLQMSQQRLAQTLAQNSAAMSNMIMDSWDRKMASDSRISQARSEATLGVNTWQNSYGQNVQVSVSADHVYENQYGDVYGVSGNAVDQDVLNQLNWKELKK